MFYKYCTLLCKKILYYILIEFYRRLENMTEKVFKVNGMSCNSCVLHVKNSVENLRGIKNIDVSLKNKNMTVKDSGYNID